MKMPAGDGWGGAIPKRIAPFVMTSANKAPKTPGLYCHHVRWRGIKPPGNCRLGLELGRWLLVVIVEERAKCLQVL